MLRSCSGSRTPCFLPGQRRSDKLYRCRQANPPPRHRSSPFPRQLVLLFAPPSPSKVVSPPAVFAFSARRCISQDRHRPVFLLQSLRAAPSSTRNPNLSVQVETSP